MLAQDIQLASARRAPVEARDALVAEVFETGFPTVRPALELTSAKTESNVMPTARALCISAPCLRGLSGCLGSRLGASRYTGNRAGRGQSVHSIYHKSIVRAF